jgi:hypothetical protein
MASYRLVVTIARSDDDHVDVEPYMHAGTPEAFVDLWVDYYLPQRRWLRDVGSVVGACIRDVASGEATHDFDISRNAWDDLRPETDDPIARAAKLGREHGEQAAREWLPGDVLRGRKVHRDGVESVRGYLPTPDLSDDYTPWVLAEDCGLGGLPDVMHMDRAADVDRVCRVYCDAFTAAVEATVRSEGGTR